MIKVIKFWDDGKQIVAQPVIIAISGLARHGKTTFARYMRDAFDNKMIVGFITGTISFAGNVKKCAINEFNWDGAKDKAGRKLLQDIGIAGRTYNPDIWAQKLLANMLTVYHKPIGISIFIIDDWRYPNELEYLKENGPFQVITMRIFRDIPTDDELYKHESETSLPADPSYYDYCIYNMGTLEDLSKNAIHLVNLLIKGEEVEC